MATLYWWIDSVQWTAVTAWATGATIAAGALRRPSAPSNGNERVVVAIVAGTTHATTEPTWTLTRGAKNTDNTVTWQECTGQPGVNGDMVRCPNWTAVKNTSPGLGTVIQNNAGTYLFICSTNGSTGNGSEPAWTLTAGVTTADNAATWTCLGVVGNFVAFGAPFPRLATAFNAWSLAPDVHFVGDDHAETQSTDLTLAPPTSGSGHGVLVYCVDHTVASPIGSSMKTTAKITTTSTANLLMTNAAYYNGIIFQAGSGANSSYIRMSYAGGLMEFVNCSLQKLGTSSSNTAFWFNFSAASENFCRLTNTTFKCGSTGDQIYLYGGANVLWRDTPSAFLGSTFPTTVFEPNENTTFEVEGVDLSALGSATLFWPNANTFMTKFINCKLGSGWVIGGQNGFGLRNDFINCDSGATNYMNARYATEGQHTPSTTIVRTGGASDGTTPVSDKIVTASFISWQNYFESMPIEIWNSTLSTNRTVTLFGIWNAAALPNNDDIWLHTEYLGSASSPLASAQSQTIANPLTTNAALPADSVSAWDSAATARANTHAYSTGDVIKLASNAGRIFFCTAGGTSAGSEPGGYASAVDGGSVTDSGATFRAGVRFKLTVTLSSPQPAQAGYIRAYVRCAKNPATFYVDPLITLG